MPVRSRRLAAVIVAAGVALLVAACSSSSPSTGSSSPGAEGSPTSASAAAYSVCMRSHAVPNFPDLDGKGNPAQADPEQLGVSTALYQAAERACAPLLPTGGSLQQQTQQCLLFGDCPQSLLQQLLTVERRFAQCLRSHGVSKWPDPTVGAKGRPVFDVTSAGIDPRSAETSQFQSKEVECRRILGGSVPTLPTT